jgi:hypothetical protein
LEVAVWDKGMSAEGTGPFSKAGAMMGKDNQILLAQAKSEGVGRMGGGPLGWFFLGGKRSGSVRFLYRRARCAVRYEQRCTLICISKRRKRERKKEKKPS